MNSGPFWACPCLFCQTVKDIVSEIVCMTSCRVLTTTKSKSLMHKRNTVCCTSKVDFDTRPASSKPLSPLTVLLRHAFRHHTGVVYSFCIAGTKPAKPAKLEVQILQGQNEIQMLALPQQKHLAAIFEKPQRCVKLWSADAIDACRYLSTTMSKHTDACLASDLLVQNLLPGAHGTLDHVLSLAGQFLLHLTLCPPQHERPQHLRNNRLEHAWPEALVT